MVTANRVRVWVRALGQECRVRVESVETAKWLVDQLTERKALTGLQFIDMTPTEDGCKFPIPNGPQRTLQTLETALQTIPGVQLMLEPESI